MNLRNYAFGIIILLTFSTYAQSEKTVEIRTDHSVTELKIEADNINELEEFDWNSVYDIFETNDPDKIIKLQLGFSPKIALENSNIEKWSITLSGKTSELESLIKKAKNILANLSEIRKN